MRSILDFVPTTTLIADIFKRARVPLPARLVLDAIATRTRRNPCLSAVARLSLYKGGRCDLVPAVDSLGRRVRGWYVLGSLPRERQVVPDDLELAVTRAKLAILGHQVPALESPTARLPGEGSRVKLGGG